MLIVVILGYLILEVILIFYKEYVLYLYFEKLCMIKYFWIYLTDL